MSVEIEEPSMVSATGKKKKKKGKKSRSPSPIDFMLSKDEGQVFGSSSREN